MPTLTINAEVALHEGGAAIHLFVDGQRLNRIGPFPDWDAALAGANAFIAEVRRSAMPTVYATQLEDLQKQPST